MTAKPLTTLNCTQCGAGLSALGGGRVKTHVCPHCGAVLDAQADYKMLAHYRDLPRPRTPFALGRSARLFGTAFTVIGTIAWQETFAGRTWRWVDHQVYSPTHGYAWLTYEDGHVVFTRKMRGRAQPAWFSAAQIEHAASRPTARFDGNVYNYYASGAQTSTFIEGEFNYVPELHARVNYVSFLRDDAMFTMLREGDEQEYEITRPLPREETLRAFGASPASWPTRKAVHPTHAFKRGPLAGFARNALFGAGATALLLALYFLSFGETITRQSLPSLIALESVPFTVTAPNGLVQIDIDTDISNGWVWLDGEVLDASEEVVTAFEDGAEFYSGRDSEGRWTEGSTRLRVRVDLPPGPYTLALSVAENVGDKKWSGRPATKAKVTIQQGIAAVSWLTLLGGLLLLGGLTFFAQRAVHNHRRWADSDWTDEDD